MTCSAGWKTGSHGAAAKAALMGVVRDIKRSYRAPRAVLRHRLGAGENEGGALVTLMLACGLIFVAQWPRLSRIAFETGQEMQMLLGGTLLAWLFIMPLFFYVLALIVHLILRAFGGHGTAYEVRMALFWGLLAAAPLWLLWGLTAGFVGPGIATTLTGIIALGAVVYFWAAGIAELFRPATSPSQDLPKE